MSAETFVRPVVQARICGGYVTVYRSPLAGPDLPWFDYAELCKAVGAPEENMPAVWEAVSAKMPDDYRLALTPYGPALLAAYPICREHIIDLQNFGSVSRDATAELCSAATAALEVYAAGLSTEDETTLIQAAIARSKMRACAGWLH